MAVTHSAAARNAATDAVTALIGTSGKLIFRLAGSVSSPGTAVATLTLSADGFGDASSGTATANSITSDTNATGNASAVANATLETSAGTVVLHCSVTASGGGGDIIMTNGLTIAAGDTVTLGGPLTYTALSA